MGFEPANSWFGYVDKMASALPTEQAKFPIRICTDNRLYTLSTALPALVVLTVLTESHLVDYEPTNSGHTH